MDEKERQEKMAKITSLLEWDGLRLADLQLISHWTALVKGWYDDATAGKRNVGEVIALMHSELSEALEEWRAGHPLDEVGMGDKGKPEGFGIELADCVIRILDTCEAHGIDLEKMIRTKMRYNLTRPYRHGGKAA